MGNAAQTVLLFPKSPEPGDFQSPQLRAHLPIRCRQSTLQDCSLQPSCTRLACCGFDKPIYLGGLRNKLEFFPLSLLPSIICQSQRGIFLAAVASHPPSHPPVEEFRRPTPYFLGDFMCKTLIKFKDWHFPSGFPGHSRADLGQGALSCRGQQGPAQPRGGQRRARPQGRLALCLSLVVETLYLPLGLRCASDDKSWVVKQEPKPLLCEAAGNKPTAADARPQSRWAQDGPGLCLAFGVAWKGREEE